MRALARGIALHAPRPRLRDVDTYRVMAARTTFATTPIQGEVAPPPPAAVPVSRGVSESAAQPVVISATTQPAEIETRRKTGRRDVEAAEREEERFDPNPPGLHAFALTYAFLLGLVALGMAIAGGATNYWVTVRATGASDDAPRLARSLRAHDSPTKASKRTPLCATRAVHDARSAY